MSDASPQTTPPRSWIRRYPVHLFAALLLVVIAVTPSEIAWFLAFLDGLLLWALFAIPLVRTMAADAAGCGKVLFGAFAVLIGGMGALLLVGFACAGPMSRTKF
jgi:hypothetical protein